MDTFVATQLRRSYLCEAECVDEVHLRSCSPADTSVSGPLLGRSPRHLVAIDSNPL
jgi:hypothetical protein